MYLGEKKLIYYGNKDNTKTGRGHLVVDEYSFFYITSSSEFEFAMRRCGGNIPAIKTDKNIFVNYGGDTSDLVTLDKILTGIMGDYAKPKQTPEYRLTSKFLDARGII